MIRMAQYVVGVTVCCTVVACSAEATRGARTAPAIFDYHSGFWVNLHHFLYVEALAEKPQKGAHPAIVSEADAEPLGSMSHAERAAWAASVSYYTDAVIQKDLLFDRSMGAIKDQLEDAEDSTDLASVSIPAALGTALLKAAPIYRKYWWKRHDEQNRQWIAHLEPLVEEYGVTLRDSLISIYGTPWPSQPVRVDVAVYAGQFGAYTTTAPTRPTISSTDPANQGEAALEVVFHEASHGMIDKVREAIAAAEAEVNAHDSNATLHSGTLWHAVLFYTTGQLVAERVRGYLPYADKNGLWTRAWPTPNRLLIEQDWKPHMDGAVPLPAAVAKLVADLAMSSSHR
jgi:hypothetical protein